MLLPLLVIAALGEAKTIIAAVGDSVTAGDQVDELFEGAPPAADARVQGAERAEQVVREAGLGGNNDDDDDAFKY